MVAKSRYSSVHVHESTGMQLGIIPFRELRNGDIIIPKSPDGTIYQYTVSDLTIEGRRLTFNITKEDGETHPYDVTMAETGVFIVKLESN